MNKVKDKVKGFKVLYFSNNLLQPFLYVFPVHIEVDGFDADGVLLVLPGKVEFVGGGGVNQHTGGIPGAGFFVALVGQVAK